MAAYTTAPSRRAKEFFDAVIHEYGIREGNHVRIPMRQCELAQRKQVAASTIGSYLSALGPAVVARYPHIVISLVDHTAPAETAPSPHRSHADELIAAYAVLVNAQARVIEVLAKSAPFPREETGDPREVREEPVGSASKEEQEDLSSFLFDEPRTETARTREELREEPETHATAIDAALEPLHVLAAHRHLKPMNNRGGVLAALSAFTVDEIRHAVSRLMSLIETGDAPVTSPFGLLVQWARSNDRTYFSEPLPCRGKRQADEPANVLLAPEPETETDPADTAAVLAMEADPDAFGPELDQLDQLVAGAHPHLATHGIRPAMRHALRVAVFHDWVTNQHTAGTPQAHPTDAAGTALAQPSHAAGTPHAHPQHTTRTPIAALTGTPRTTNGTPR